MTQNEEKNTVSEDAEQGESYDDENKDEKVLDADFPLDKVVFYAFDEACQKLEQTNEVEPFTVVVSGDNLYVESHPGSTIDECFDSARNAIEIMTQLADAYVFCYDGYVKLDGRTRDALIAERAKKGDKEGEAFAMFYHIDEDGSVSFEDAIYDVGEAASLFLSSEFDEQADEQAEAQAEVQPEARFDAQANGQIGEQADERIKSPDGIERPDDLDLALEDDLDLALEEFLDLAMTDDLEQAFAAMSDD